MQKLCVEKVLCKNLPFKEGEWYELPQGETTVGRSDCTITVAEPTVSRVQFTIRNSPPFCTIVHHGRNATKVNGERVNGEMPLNNNDCIIIHGVIVFRFIQEARSAIAHVMPNEDTVDY